MYGVYQLRTLAPGPGISAGINNCIPQYSVKYNYLSLPDIPASAAKFPSCVIFGPSFS